MPGVKYTKRVSQQARYKTTYPLSNLLSLARPLTDTTAEGHAGEEPQICAFQSPDAATGGKRVQAASLRDVVCEPHARIGHRYCSDSKAVAWSTFAPLGLTSFPTSVLNMEKNNIATN